MALTNERAEMLINYINENQEERLELFELDANEAIEKINADGLDVTTEEFEEFAEAIEQAIANSSEEMDENSLDDVSGGVYLGIHRLDKSYFTPQMKYISELLVTRFSGLQAYRNR